jgi:phosphohistidine swiveling domain-containing protein
MTRASPQSVSSVAASAPASARVIPLDRAEDARATGAKAHNLARMRRLNLPVPPGFVITAGALEDTLLHNDLSTRIEAATRQLNPRDPPSLRRASEAVRALLEGAEVPRSLRDEISAACARLLPGSAVIVRSSAVGEDGAASSFAGQLDSILDVRGEDELFRAILACWSSYWSDRCLFYQASREALLLGMGIVVQELVQSKISGVLFTEAPGAPSGDELFAEYCFGQGTALVSGAINPGSFAVSRASLRVRRIAAPEQEAIAGAAALLTDACIVELARAALSLEAHFGAPQDIEWTLDPLGRLFLVQSRPITTSKRANERASSSAAPRVTWSNANVNENFPAPISPLLYSIASAGYSNYFKNLAKAYGISERRIRAMEDPLRSIIGVHGARMYYNLTNIHAFLSVAPFGDTLAEYFNTYVGASAPDGKKPGIAPRRGVGRAADLAELAVVAATTANQYRTIENKIREFEARVDAFAERTRPPVLAEKSKNELLADLRAFVDIRCNRWTNASLADAASAVCYGLLKQALREALPDADQGALHNTLLKGLPDIVSSQPAVEIWELSRLVRADAELRALLEGEGGAAVLIAIERDKERGGERFAAFRSALDRSLERWGFRGSGELMLTEPSFQEDPAGLLAIVKTYMAIDGTSPAEVMKRQDEERVAETARVIALLRDPRRGSLVSRTLRARAVSLLLGWTQRSIGLRERARLKQALLYSRFRRVALAIGEALVKEGGIDAPADIFFLTHQEIDALLSGSAMFPYRVRDLIALRREEHRELSSMAPPDVITLPEGDYLEMAGAAALAEGAKAASPGGAAPDDLRGAGTCGGRITAPAAVIGDMSEAHRLAAGDVLVTRQTDPGWGPVFFLIKGLVMERGGMLSHGAIIAREFGIPAVVGVREATQRIRHGSTVAVDGDRGTVRLLD